MWTHDAPGMHLSSPAAAIIQGSTQSATGLVSPVVSMSYCDGDPRGCVCNRKSENADFIGTDVVGRAGLEPALGLPRRGF
jgi:hypothetical protein